MKIPQLLGNLWAEISLTGQLFHVELWLTWGFTSLVRHVSLLVINLFSDCPAPLTPSTAKLMEKKTSKHERNDAKTRGCVWVIYGDESAFGVKMHVIGVHTVLTHRSQSMHSHTNTHKYTVSFHHFRRH